MIILLNWTQKGTTLRFPPFHAPFLYPGKPKRSQPVLLLKMPQQRHHDDHTDHDGHRIAVFPGELRHAHKIHAIPAGEQGKGEKDHGHHGKELHQLILLDGQLGLVGLPHLTDDVLEIAHRPQVTVHSAAQNHHASADRPGEKLVLIGRQLVQNGGELLIVSF